MTARAFYFRQAERPLFGVYHSARCTSARSAAVLLCQPLGHEYIRCHRAFRLLAEQLAAEGFPTLRFDYYGCGDSAGDSVEGDMGQWVKDVSVAVRECQDRSGTERIAAVGLRLGASLALLCAQGATVLDSLVLWNAVVSGRRYLSDLHNLHRELQHALPRGGPQRTVSTDSEELVGFAYPPNLLEQLSVLDLTRSASPPVKRILVLETSPQARQGAQADREGLLSGEADHVAVPGPMIWLERASDALGGALVPRLAINAILSWLCEVYV